MGVGVTVGLMAVAQSVTVVAVGTGADVAVGGAVGIGVAVAAEVVGVVDRVVGGEEPQPATMIVSEARPRTTSDPRRSEMRLRTSTVIRTTPFNSPLRVSQ